MNANRLIAMIARLLLGRAVGAALRRAAGPNGGNASAGRLRRAVRIARRTTRF